MSDTYDLSHLDPNSFEQMVNVLAMTVLGAGHTGFGPGADGGRDGLFEGTAPYPSTENRWSGTWYIQSKFHKPHLSKDPQKWLTEQISAELSAFAEDTDRKWPDNWIVATNIEPSGKPETGAFDKARDLVKSANPKLLPKFHIWGGRKIIDLLMLNPSIASYYGHFLTPGHVITALYDTLRDEKASIQDIVRFLVVKEFETHQFTKLDQAGSEADTRPGVHKLFVDLPFKSELHKVGGLVAEELLKTAGKAHHAELMVEGEKWRRWQNFPARARVWFIQGGPGQGKSTTGQYFSQLQRAALIKQWDGDPIPLKCREAAADIEREARHRNHWSNVPRIPINIELKDYAQWFGTQSEAAAAGVLSYLSHRISAYVDKPVSPATIKRALRTQRWFVVFDGLDEVPNDVKDRLAAKVKDFINDTTVECNSDVHFICTSRPQGYSGQFDDLECAVVKLIELSPSKALECAEPVIKIGRTETEAEKGIAILRSAIASPAVKALMTTPLQSHIMAVVVRDGKKPPERRWQLFENFYQVIKRREANRDLPDENIAKLLREEEQLLRTIHNRLGFVLHAKAETSEGAQTSLSRHEFKTLATKAVAEMKSDSTTETVAALMEATATRLVLVNTPDDGDNLRFDIRQLQEFFAAEFIHDAVTLEEFRERVSTLTGDAHWREVLHFLLSAMVESRRLTEIGELVQALEALNEGGTDESCRTTNRRLARGALLTARILQDGVLEQDKRVRLKFRNSLEPLTASIDTNDIEALYTLEHPDTRAWIIDYCLERLREADHAESVGAAVLATHLLRDDDQRIDEFIGLVESKPSSFQSEVFGSWIAHRREKLDNVKQWLVRLALRHLVKKDWYRLGSNGVSGACSILDGGRRHVDSELRTIGYPDVHLPLVSLLNSDTYHRFDADTEIENEEDFGIIRVGLSRFDWQKGGSRSESLNQLPNEVILGDQFGLFSLLDAIWRFANEHSYPNFRRLLNHLPRDPAWADAVPSSLTHYIPFDIRSAEWPLRDNFSATEFEKWIASAERPLIYRSADRPQMPDKDQWKRLIEKHPNVAIHIVFNGWIFPDVETDKFFSPDYVLPLALAVIEQPLLLKSSNILKWGVLFEATPQSLHPKIRSSFVEAVYLESEHVFWQGHHDMKVVAFEVSIPAEMKLIPVILAASIRYASFRGQMFFTQVSSSKKQDPMEEVARLINAFFPDESLIPNVLLDSAIPTLDDAFIGLLRVFHPNLQESLVELFPYLVKLFSRTPNRSLLEIVIFYVRHRLPEEDANVVSFVSRLLDLSREDFEMRKIFYPLLHAWREKSHSPATKANALSRWL